ncbi:MAG: PAS domain-containing protein, partial [Rhodospirillales bacterium]|nr:PAS domain-containing protein [Rhodospirillales bacterium]
PDDRRTVQDHIRKALEDKKNYQFELRLRLPGQAIRHVRSMGAVKLDQNGEVDMLFGVFNDITGDRLIREQLDEKTKRLEEAEKLGNIGHWSVDAKSGELYWSDEVYRIHGLEPGSEITVEEAIKAYHPEDRQYVSDYVEAALEKKDDFQFEHRIIRPSGEVRYVRSTGAVKLDSKGDIETIFGVFQDITEKKQTELDLEHQKSLFEAVFNESIDAIVIADKERNIILCNPAVTKIYGYEPEELIGQKTEIFYPSHEDYEKLGQERFNEDVGRAEGLFEIGFKCKDGSIIPCEAIGTPFNDHLGEVAGYIAVTRNISERKEKDSRILKAMDEAIKASYVKSTFLANMSHELRTPLNSILGFSQIIHTEQFGPNGNAMYKEYAGDIFSSGTHLLALITDILDISKIEAGAMELMEDVFSLKTVIKECLDMVRGRIDHKNINLNYCEPETVFKCHADKRRVKQILLNLIGNSIKFTPERGSIEINLAINKTNSIILRVCDTGVGISQEDLKNITKPFYQARTSASIATDEGTGLGLSLVESFTKLHGGDFAIESDIGKGTTVTIEFPPERTV